MWWKGIALFASCFSAFFNNKNNTESPQKEIISDLNENVNANYNAIRQKKQNQGRTTMGHIRYG